MTTYNQPIPFSVTFAAGEFFSLLILLFSVKISLLGLIEVLGAIAGISEVWRGSALMSNGYTNSVALCIDSYHVYPSQP